MCMIWSYSYDIQASGRRIKSEADALDHTAGERVSSWRERREVGSIRTHQLIPRAHNLATGASMASGGAGPPGDNTNVNGTALEARPRQPSGIHEIVPSEADEEQSLSLCQFPSMPTESSWSYQQSVRQLESASQATTVPVHEPTTTEQPAQPMSDASQTLHDSAPQRTPNVLTVPQTTGDHMLAVPGASSPSVRPSSTASENVPSLILDLSPSSSSSARS